MESYTNKMFGDQMRINKQTFFFVCEILGPCIKKHDTLMTASVDVETRVVVTLARFAIGNTLSMIGDLYGIVESTTSVIIQEWCRYSIKKVVERTFKLFERKMKDSTVGNKWSLMALQHFWAITGVVLSTISYKSPIIDNVLPIASLAR